MRYDYDLAKFRQADLMREAEAYRRGKEIRVARAKERRASLYRMVGAAVSFVLGPFRH